MVVVLKKLVGLFFTLFLTCVIMKSVLLVLGVGNDGVGCRRCRCRHRCRRYHRHHYRCLCYRPCRYCYRRHNCYVQFYTNNDTNDITLTCSLLYRLLNQKKGQ